MLISMIGHTFAAKPFAGTGLIRTIAAVFIRLGFAFHPGNPYEDEREPAKIGEKSGPEKSHRSVPPEAELRVQTL